MEIKEMKRSEKRKQRKETKKTSTNGNEKGSKKRYKSNLLEISSLIQVVAWEFTIPLPFL
jgi:hypothetical protein